MRRCERLGFHRLTDTTTLSPFTRGVALQQIACGIRKRAGVAGRPVLSKKIVGGPIQRQSWADLPSRVLGQRGQWALARPCHSCFPPKVFDAAHAAARLHARDWPCARLHLRGRCPTLQAAAADRLPDRGHCHWAVYTRLRRRPKHSQPACRGRRHPPDVRCGTSLLAGRSLVGPRHSRARRDCAGSRGNAARDGTWLVAWLDARGGHHLRHCAVGRGHRRAVAALAGAPPGRDRARSHHRGLADRTGHRHGAGARDPAGLDRAVPQCRGSAELR